MKKQLLELVSKLSETEYVRDSIYKYKPIFIYDILHKLGGEYYPLSDYGIPNHARMAISYWYKLGIRKSLQEIIHESGWESDSMLGQQLIAEGVSIVNREDRRIEPEEKLKNPDAQSLLKVLLDYL